MDVITFASTQLVVSYATVQGLVIDFKVMP